MASSVLAVLTVGLSAGLWATRRWGRWPGRWLVWPQAAGMLLISETAYLGRLPALLARWPSADKVLHFLLFGGAAFWLDLWLGGRRWRGLPVAAALMLAAATLDELAQAFSPVRTVDLGDWACGAAGILALGWLAGRLGAALEARREGRCA